MGKLLLCMGKYAKTPYFMEKVPVNLYSVEELCYCLLKNAYLIDQGIMDGRLEEWLAGECGLRELAAHLGQLANAGCSVGGYAGAVLEYVGYGDRETWAEAVGVLEEGKDLSLYEKRKTRADYLVEHKRYAAALKSYGSLLEELPEVEKELRAGILHNQGVAYAQLFRFQNAAQCFEEAYGCGRGEDELIHFLAAKRMVMEETEYVDFAAGQEDPCGAALKVEKAVEDAAKEFEGTEESRMLFTLGVCREENHSVSYYEETGRLVRGLKDHYREITAE